MASTHRIIIGNHEDFSVPILGHSDAQLSTLLPNDLRKVTGLESRRLLVENVLRYFMIPVVNRLSTAHVVVVGVRAPRAENILAVARIVSVQKNSATRQNSRPFFRVLAQLFAELQRWDAVPRTIIIVRLHTVELEVAVNRTPVDGRRSGVAKARRISETRR